MMFETNVNGTMHETILTTVLFAMSFLIFETSVNGTMHETTLTRVLSD